MTDRLTAAFAELGVAVEATQGERALGAVLITTDPPSRLWLYLAHDAEPVERLALLDEIHQALRVLAGQVDQARQVVAIEARRSG